MSRVAAKVGIVDWGIGGLGILRLARKRFGRFSVTYFSDTGTTPYGKMTRHELVSRLNEVLEYLRQRGVTHVIFGCNAASTVASRLDARGLRIHGMIESAVRLARRARPRRLAVIGGRRTILSGVYRRALAGPHRKVAQRIAQPLSGLIEKGDTGSVALRDECRRILAPIGRSSHILLACTHYPAIRPVLEEFVSRDTVLLDPALEIVRTMSRWRLGRSGPDAFLTTGDPAAMKRAAWQAFRVRLSAVKRVRLAGKGI